MKALPKGIRIDHGYVQVRIFHAGAQYCRNFGLDSPLARELASIHLAEKRKEILMGKAGIAIELPSKTFKEVAEIYYELWSKETDPEGRPKHNDASCRSVRGWLDGVLMPEFGHLRYECIRSIEVQKWRDRRVRGVLGTTANREQGVLSSLFSHIEMWVKSGKIKRAFKLPPENPCAHVEKASNRKRERVLSTQELRLLHGACTDDADLWEIIKMALKSLLRKKDLMRLEAGMEIDMTQAKTGVRIDIPVQLMRPLNYANFRKRWEAARRSAALVDVQFRDLRKTGANLLKMRNHSTKLISEFLGHTSTDTTEIYMVKNNEHLRPLAHDLDEIVEAL